jgi:hypothetical protein
VRISTPDGLRRARSRERSSLRPSGTAGKRSQHTDDRSGDRERHVLGGCDDAVEAALLRRTNAVLVEIDDTDVRAFIAQRLGDGAVVATEIEHLEAGANVFVE